ncbi:MAG: carboxypeptidase regulatory-like domain-containing protein [Pseudomonadota bacterium]|nr:carboxypeptidase regulatory-like domain-containing protein [Pseudomonadota bacterium]
MNRTQTLRRSKLALGLIAALAAAPVFAQSTSAGVGGLVTGGNGQPVANAEVTITHVESGTVSRVTTDASGRYNARGLRVGGPYTIVVNKAGEGTETENNIYLPLNQVATVNATLRAQQALDTVVVVGTAGPEIFSQNRMGTATNVTRETMDALPSANRNIQDFIRLDPRISQVSKADGAISAGGQNSRYNAIKIDGVSASDPFGLESNNLPTERQPVSMDAIQEINIDLANYDTTIFGGTGAVINAVTKSGTNKFTGSVYGAYRDGDWVRKDLRGIPFAGFTDEKTYGMTLGGPIMKDRLFFFVNYEKFVRNAPGISLSDTPYGRQIFDADITAVQNAATAWGFSAGSVDVPGNKTEIEEYAAKIDWNINDSHRFAIRYSNMEQTVARFPGLASGTVSLSSYWYDQPKTFKSVTAELFSDWSENFTTEFKISRRDYRAERVPYSNLPSIRINGFGTNNSSIFVGTEQNTHVNIIDTKETTAFGAGIFYAGDHTIKFGADYSKNDVLNFYGRNLNGVYVFNSLADFVAGTPSTYQLRAPRAGGSRDDIPASYTLKNLGLFAQDSWAITPDFTLMFGVRIDKPDFSDQRFFNQRVYDVFGYDNTNTVDKKLVQPRIGFNWTPMSDLRAQLRGGVGLFSGAAPNVWLSGTYSNTGLNYVEYDLRGANAPAFSPQVPPSTTGMNPAAGRQNVDIAAPGLRLPSVWKANLAWEQELGWNDVVFSVELLATKVKDAIYFERLDVMNPTTTGPDGRAIYWNDAGRNPANAGRFGMETGRVGGSNCSAAVVNAGRCPDVKANRPGDIGDVMLMRNTSKGSSQQFTIGVQKPLTETWGWSAFYTRTNAWEVSPLTSSQNTSNWNNTLIFNANENVARRSRYALQDRVSGTVEFKKAFFGDYNTRVGLFYEGRSGRPFSYIFYNDVNGDGANTNDLFYVPAAPGDVLWMGNTAADRTAMEQAFFSWLDQNPELAKYKGQVAPANAFKAKWTNSFDLRISQELPGFWRGHKSEISLDIMNIGNLINKDWGLIDDYGFFSTRRVANYAGIDPNTGKYIYNFTGSTDNPQIQENNNDKGNTGVSRWSVMLGLRYKF